MRILGSSSWKIGQGSRGRSPAIPTMTPSSDCMWISRVRVAPERLYIESECLMGLIPPNQSADMDCSGKSLTLHGITEMISEGVRTEGRLLAALLTAGAKSHS